MIAKLSKIVTVVGAYAFYQASELMGGIFDKAFDNMFSLGLLLLVVYFLWKDNRTAREYNQRRDERMEELVKHNSDAINGFKSAMDNLSSTLRELRNEIRNK